MSSGRKITSKADLAHHDPTLRVGGHAVDTNRGVMSSVSTLVRDILTAGTAAGVDLDEATVRLVAQQDARAQLMHLLKVNQAKYDFKYNTFMHNHAAQLLLAFYRLGADG